MGLKPFYFCNFPKPFTEVNGNKKMSKENEIAVGFSRRIRDKTINTRAFPKESFGEPYKLSLLLNIKRLCK